MSANKKHVIVLGAGASWSSGYPLAPDLRLLTCSRQDFIAYVDEKIKGTKLAGQQMVFVNYFDGIKQAIDLFRSGGFATIDEFCFLAGKAFPREVQELKRLMRIIFLLHDPEKDFHKSDYYPFIQRLFKKNLHDLRDDICILSYNYDPYLEYLLWTAHITRKQSIGQDPDFHVLDDVSSGFFTRGLATHRDRRLLVLKLHGICLLPSANDKCPSLSFGDSFDNATRGLLHQRLPELHHTTPPIIFPWELHPLNGERCSKDKFCLTDADLYKTGSDLSHAAFKGDIHSLFDGIWTRAQMEISEAVRISFIGLSMHDYLEPGLRQLFAGRASWYSRGQYEKTKNIEVIVANPDAVKPDATLGKDYGEILCEVCPGLQPSIRCRRDFAEFINKDMGPISAEPTPPIVARRLTGV